MAAALSNKKIQDNLRDGFPFPYTEQDAKEFIEGMLAANENETFAYNSGSCRVLEKAGFQFEGVLRSNAVKNGRLLDMRMYARLRDSV